MAEDRPVFGRSLNIRDDEAGTVMIHKNHVFRDETGRPAYRVEQDCIYGEPVTPEHFEALRFDVQTPVDVGNMPGFLAKELGL